MTKNTFPNIPRIRSKSLQFNSPENEETLASWNPHPEIQANSTNLPKPRTFSDTPEFNLLKNPEVTDQKALDKELENIAENRRKEEKLKLTHQRNTARSQWYDKQKQRIKKIFSPINNLIKFFAGVFRVVWKILMFVIYVLQELLAIFKHLFSPRG